MKLEDIRLTAGEKIGLFTEPLTEHENYQTKVANSATDKAIKTMLEYLESKGDWILNYEITEQERIWNWAIPHDDYIVLKKLVEEA